MIRLGPPPNKKKPMNLCSVCHGPVQYGNAVGICNTNLQCKREYNRVQMAQKRQRSRDEHSENYLQVVLLAKIFAKTISSLPNDTCNEIAKAVTKKERQAFFLYLADELKKRENTLIG